VLHDDLKKARLDAGLTTAQAAERLGINQSSLSRIETGETAVSSQRLIDLARLYGVSPSKLLDGAVVNALAEEDLNRLGQVITFVEDVLQGQETRPSPETIRDTILAIFRQESEAAWESGAEFNPARYRDLISILVKKRIEQE